MKANFHSRRLRRLSLGFLAAAIGILGYLPSAIDNASAASPDRPNFLLVLLDDLRFDALHCTGHPFAKTPNIDRLAREGGLFQNAFVATPLCVPSRACFLTGQYAHTNGVTGGGSNYNELGRKLVTFPRLLQAAGYETAFLGKWHIGDDDSPRPGFDHWVSFSGQGDYTKPKLNIDGCMEAATGYLTDLLTEHAVEFIRKGRTRPFAMVLAHKAVHAPWIPAPRHAGLYSSEPIERAPSVRDTLEGKPILSRKSVKLSPGDSDLDTSDDVVRNQLRCLAAVDEGLARLLDALEAAGRLDQTVIVFTSDNGWFWGEHGLAGKHSPYEESIRVPLLVRYPPLIRPGTRFQELVLNIDLAPTVLELAGVAIPREMEGRSLRPVLKGSAAPWRKTLFAEYFYQPGQTPRFPTWQAVRTHQWKYIHYPDYPGMDELYDLERDRYEMTNRIGAPDAQEILGGLKHQLR